MSSVDDIFEMRLDCIEEHLAREEAATAERCRELERLHEVLVQIYDLLTPPVPPSRPNLEMVRDA